MPARFLEVFVMTVLGSFVGLTLVSHIFTYRLLRAVWRWDVFRLLPNYRLFWAMPRDLRLSIRDRRTSGELTAWRAILLWRERLWYQAVWHLQHLVPHVLSSLVEDLVTLAAAQGIEERYQLASVDCSRRFQAGELGDDTDLFEWSAFYHMWLSALAQLTSLGHEATAWTPIGIWTPSSSRWLRVPW